MKRRKKVRAYSFLWISTLYFIEGLPNIIVTFLACLMYKRLGLSNTDAVLYTSWLYLPWVIKPTWSPFIDIFGKKRIWILITQFFLGIGMAGVAFTLPLSSFIQWTLFYFWLIAFTSATHDIAADGYYMLALNEEKQSFYVGFRSTAYRVATIAGQGLLTSIAGTLEVYTRNPTKAWAITFWITSGIFFTFWLWHILILPHSQNDTSYTNFKTDNKNLKKEIQLAANQFCKTIKTFFSKKNIGISLCFLLLYRLPEGLLTKICPLFYVDTIEKGGLGLTTSEVGFLQGIVGVIGLLLGGLLGGIAISKGGLKKWIWPMAISITLPDIVYIYLAYYQPENFQIINSLVFIEQFGYGFGFTSYLIYMLYIAQGPSKTAHYAFCTGFMALSLMLPGSISGWLQDQIGYLNFFIVVLFLTPLTLIVSYLSIQRNKHLNY